MGQTRKVSMKSGLEGRNNQKGTNMTTWQQDVSMKSGLEGRNNDICNVPWDAEYNVSMKSGLEGRNNKKQRPKKQAPKLVSQ